MTLMLIPPGDFMMGSSAEDFQKISSLRGAPAAGLNNFENEGPVHQGQLTKAFYLSVHELTRGQFRAFADAIKKDLSTKRESPGLQDLHPAANISWEDCKELCTWLNAVHADQFRLPTEAAWEYACRAGANSRYHFEETQLQLGDSARFSSYGRQHPDQVGMKKPNGFSFFEMHRNVMEWYSDWNGETYYGESPQNYPWGPERANTECDGAEAGIST